MNIEDDGEVSGWENRCRLAEEKVADLSKQLRETLFEKSVLEINVDVLRVHVKVQRRIIEDMRKAWGHAAAPAFMDGSAAGPAIADNPNAGAYVPGMSKITFTAGPTLEEAAATNKESESEEEE